MVDLLANYCINPFAQIPPLVLNTAKLKKEISIKNSHSLIMKYQCRDLIWLTIILKLISLQN